MTIPSRMSVCCAVLILTAVISFPALAAEPQPGLWNQTMNMDMSGMEMPQMPAMPPEVLAQMQAAGIQMPNMDFSQPRTMSNQFCITPEDIANRESFGDDFDDDCEQQNFVSNDQGMSMDLVCTGRMNGTGHLEYVFDSATHYTGSMNFTGTMEGRQANMTNTMEGSWVSADCGNVAP
nr:MAG: DUF3617 domain-containing protein [Hyphomicrobiales bacterium]